MYIYFGPFRRLRHAFFLQRAFAIYTCRIMSKFDKLVNCRLNFFLHMWICNLPDELKKSCKLCIMRRNWVKSEVFMPEFKLHAQNYTIMYSGPHINTTACSDLQLEVNMSGQFWTRLPSIGAMAVIVSKLVFASRTCILR